MRAVAESAAFQCDGHLLHVRYVAGFQMLSEVLLDVDGLHEVEVVLFCRCKVGEQHLLCRRLLLVGAVVLLNLGLLVGEEPEGLALRQLVHGLGVESGVVDGRIGVDDARQFYAEVASRAVAARQWLCVVSRGDERSESRCHRVLIGAHLSYLYVALRQQALDFRLFAVGLGVVLVDVHQRHAP